ncbi:MAG: hypothetical protein PHV34_18275 [Verrucomicrobiae bacterium]|nr:hypothetical protein [Verrucomicrobiae bacterium]
MKMSFLTALASVAILTGCGSGEAPKAPAEVKKESSSVVTAPVDYLAGTMKAGEQMKGKAELAVLQKAIDACQAENEKYPASLDELVAKGFIKVMPAAPAGLQFSYDPATGRVQLTPKQ